MGLVWRAWSVEPSNWRIGCRRPLVGWGASDYSGAGFREYEPASSSDPQVCMGPVGELARDGLSRRHARTLDCPTDHGPRDQHCTPFPSAIPEPDRPWDGGGGAVCGGAAGVGWVDPGERRAGDEPAALRDHCPDRLLAVRDCGGERVFQEVWPRGDHCEGGELGGHSRLAV